MAYFRFVMGGASYTSLRLQGFDADALREIVRGGQFEHHILQGDPCHVRHERWQYEDVVLDRGRYSFPALVRGAFSRSLVCVGFVGSAREDTWINGSTIPNATLQVYPEGSDIEYRAGPDARWAAIQIGKDRLQRTALRYLGRELKLPSRHMHSAPVDGDALARLTGRMSQAVRDSSTRGGRAARLTEAVTAACAAAIAGMSARSDSRPDSRGLRCWEVVRRADAFLRRHLTEGYTSIRLCRHLAVSERNLPLCFQSACGMSPKAWHRCLALHAARSRLRQAAAHGRTVTEIAHECGFLHRGRFSTAYRQLFGESPSRSRGVNSVIQQGAR